MPVGLRPATEAQMEPFLRLKKAMLESPILRLPLYGRPYTVDIDASKEKLECALLREQADGELMPVGY